ncbi:MAG: GDSL-type esterase/lipase family protein, partial [Oscillospiraceae bacterium]
RIFIMLGSNGITSAAAMEDSYRTLIEKLEANCPDSKIYLLSVTPVTDDSSSAANAGISNDMIVDFNKYIKSLANEQGLTYIDLYTLFSDDNGYFLHEYAENDGLHFKGNTYKVMLSYIESII